MRGPGLFDMLHYAAGLSMAGPMFVIGFEFARTGQVALGVGFFALGALVSYAPTYFIHRIGGPRTWIRRGLRRSGSSDDETDDGNRSTSDGDDRTTGDARRDGGVVRRLLERFDRRRTDD